MIAIEQITELRHQLAHLRQERSNEGRIPTVGFVPTMGYLHEGHASLIQAAKEQCDIVVLSIFVNPIQFGPNEDLDKYPRDAERDLALAKRLGVDLVFLPTVDTMYPTPTKTKVKVEEVTTLLCGARRPGHFDGVTTVVSKLFNIVQPDYAFFGMKDAQQVAVIQQMVSDLNFPVTIVPCPIIREEDGLALSSRNVYLSVQQRQEALVLSQSLYRIDAWMQSEEVSTVSQLRDRIIQHIETSPGADIDYVEILSFPQLTELDASASLQEHKGQAIIALAVRFGTTRLIDNRIL
ncbi:pantoate--beta-alanine ligase [Paenibacillus terrigena]|uniref:pantoate--beta-alanine ligase n=1 Tax=Paenibacillus terrigena TaxID=369333 RepID=UPI0028D0C092|nr:pantoate--beta-alanine ligase [Paenibacillus terrigena]